MEHTTQTTLEEMDQLLARLSWRDDDVIMEKRLVYEHWTGYGWSSKTDILKIYRDWSIANGDKAPLVSLGVKDVVRLGYHIVNPFISEDGVLFTPASGRDQSKSLE